MKTRWWIALAAGLLAGTAAAGSGCVAYASDEIRIIGESEEETAPSDQAEDAAAEERVQGGTSAENSTESITETRRKEAKGRGRRSAKKRRKPPALFTAVCRKART